MADISKRQAIAEELIWVLDSRFTHLPGITGGTSGAVIRKSQEYCITQLSTWEFALPAGAGAYAHAYFYPPIPTKRYNRILWTLTHNKMKEDDYVTINYQVHTLEEEIQFVVHFFLTSQVIKYMDYTGGYVEATTEAPIIATERGGEIEMIVDLEQKRYESVRIGRNRYRIGKPGRVTENVDYDTGTLLTLRFTSQSGFAQSIYTDKVEIFQS